jgi:hypothetical protein
MHAYFDRLPGPEGLAQLIPFPAPADTADPLNGEKFGLTALGEELLRALEREA